MVHARVQGLLFCFENGKTRPPLDQNYAEKVAGLTGRP